MSEFPNVLVTGAAGDIGRELVACFLNLGHRVLALDIQPHYPENFQGFDRLVYRSCDLTDPAATADLIQAFVDEYGVIEVLLNNVGLIYNCPVISYIDGKLSGHTIKDWDRVISVTLSTTFHITTTCVGFMVQKGKGGVIINISSISASGNAGQSAYSAAKGAVNSMTLAQAKELGAFGIRVAAIAPGFIDTPSTLRALGAESLRKIKRSIPLRRLGLVSEVCHAAVFILENQYFTGTVLELNGGLSI